MPNNLKPDVLYLITVSAMLVCDEADIVPSISITGTLDQLIPIPIQSWIGQVDKVCDFKDSPITDVRPMTKEEVDKWRKDREGACEDIETVVKLYP